MFSRPKTKYIRITKDDHFKIDEHILSTAPAQSEAACSYDLDECDVAWLKLVNGERAACGLGPISEDQLERILERLELRCWDKIQSILRNEEGLGIEFDENVICDVCRSPDSEEGNEMVFCDSCNICVHQACYGITRIPDGQWLCCTCALSQRPDCVLCPNKGGAMKSTRSGQKWAHVSCALWIPEVSIGCVEKMEPITKISSIPQSRWALICVLCRERVGACIQCSVKTCKTAYHVTCAFKHGLEMRAIIEDENADDGVKLRSYCEKHSKSSKKEKSTCSGSEDDDCKRKKRKDMTSEEKNQARAARLQEIEAEFYKHVSVKDITVSIDIDVEALQYVYNYWKLKRKAGHNKPLLPPKSEDVDMLSHKQEQADLEKMKTFVQLRQDLERVRNLCYMVCRREKLSRSFFRMREQTFHKQASVLSSASLSVPVVQAIIEANHGPSIYDRLYSYNEAEDHTADFDVILARIAGIKSPKRESNEDKKPEINGLFKDVKNNSYKKLYFNGSSKKRSRSLYGSSISSASSSDEKPKENKENHLHTGSENEKPSGSPQKRKTPSKKNNKALERRRKRLSISSRNKLDSSSEEDVKPIKKDWGLSKSRLKQIENEYSMSGSDSDELVPIKTSKPHSDSIKVKAISSIYSDSDSSDLSTKNDDKSSNTASDSQQSRLRTKAAVKEFSQKPTTSKTTKKKLKPEENKKEPPKKKDYVPSDLIVPQRQAAKIASENLKSTTSRTKEQPPPPENETKCSSAEKKKYKTKTKPSKDIKEIIKETKDCLKDNKELNKETKKDLKEPTKINDIFDVVKDLENKPTEKKPKYKTKPKSQKEIIAREPCKDAIKEKEPKELKENKENKKENKGIEPIDLDKEIEKIDPDVLSYVPQRQAAIKAAEHIKSGLVKPTPTEIPNEPVKKDADIKPKRDESKPKKEETKLKKEEPNKSAEKIESKRKSLSTKPEQLSNEIAKKGPECPKDEKEPDNTVKLENKSSSNSSSSSSSSSSSDSSSCSSSESEEEVIKEETEFVLKEETKLIDEKLQNRSIFSPQPQPKDDLLDFDNILEDGFGIAKDEEIMKGPLTFSFGNVPLFKEDSKEDSARETLVLVEKLRLELSKKSTTYDIDDTISIASSTKNEPERIDFSEQIVPNNVAEVVKEDTKILEQAQINLSVRVEVSEAKLCENKDDFQYVETAAETNVNVLQPQSDHNATTQADERWVPPSGNYPNMIKNFSEPEVSQTYLQQFSDNHHLLEQAPLNSSSPLLKKSPSIHERQLSQTPFNDSVSMDVASPSPYADMHPHNKWNESHLMVTRRSSSSSAVSQSSTCSRRNEVEDELMKRQDMMLINHSALEIAFGGIPPSFPPNSLETFPPFSEASQFVSPVSLFPPPNINTQLPFPSPGPAMYPPSFGAPFPAPHSVIPPLPKPVEDALHFPSACTAAFTSSQHNMALTAAMVNIPPPLKEPVPENNIPPPPPPPIVETQPIPTPIPIPEVTETPVLSNTTPTSNHVQPSPNPSLKSNSSTGKKSPSKPTRTSARVMSNLNKSPTKSPGKSPLQEVSTKSSSLARSRAEIKRGSGKASTGRGGQAPSRGRGRGRGRGRSYMQHNDYSNTIHNNLAGTVYDLDFDEDISNDNMADLRALRERRKSIDIHDRKEAHLSRDSSPSSKFASPKTRSFNTDLRDLRPPTPIEDVSKVDLQPLVVCETPKTFPDIVQPVLPGPVDMRTYSSSFEQQTYNEANLLGAFSGAAPEQQVHDDIDEELEKEFQSDLTASLKKAEEPPMPEVSNIKVSLSDSRNQLKVKIKGPIANYTSTVAPLPPAVDLCTAAITNPIANNAINNTNTNPTSNLRRMRKKELLRQYVSQDMNKLGDPGTSQGTLTPTVPPISRTIITIPKAVASMTTIPTKEDYRDYRSGVDEMYESKHRKESKARSGGLSRELKHLDLSLDDDSTERRRSAANFSHSLDSALKRRGRPPRPQTTPKLKIKISGNSIVGGTTKVDDKKDRSSRPPKKRLAATITMPSVEDLKRESMKFRKRVIADFGEKRRKRKDKSERRKKKKRKQEVQIISNESTNSTKLIIRFGKKTANHNSDNKRTSLENNVKVSAEVENDRVKETISDTNSCEGPSALRLVRATKITPIKLKISRCQEGSGYVMKTDQSVEDEVAKEESPRPPLALKIADIAHTPAPLPLNKDCEVR